MFLSAVSPGLFLYQTLEADWEAWKGRLGAPVSKIRTTGVLYWVNVSVSSADRFVPLRRGSLDRTNLNQNQSIRFQNTVFTGFVTDGRTNERTGNPFVRPFWLGVCIKTIKKLTPWVAGSDWQRRIARLAGSHLIDGCNSVLVHHVLEQVLHHERCISDRVFVEEDPVLGDLAASFHVVADDRSATVLGRSVPDNLHRRSEDVDSSGS